MMAYIRIIRPIHCVTTVVAVLLGMLIVYTDVFRLPNVYFVLISAFLIVAGGFVINDFYDRELDAIGKKYRNPVASGEIDPRNAQLLAHILFMSGFVVSLFTMNLLTISLAGLSIILLYLYSSFFKPKHALIGNFVTSLSTSITYIYGWSIFAVFSQRVLLGLTSMFTITIIATIGREIVKGIQDVEADSKKEIKTVAVRYKHDLKFASMVAILVLILSVFVSPIPYILGVFKNSYLGLFFIADAIVLSAVAFLHFNPSPNVANIVKKSVFVAMIIGLLAFGIGWFIDLQELVAVSVSFAPIVIVAAMGRLFR